jgi:uncharacterized membrane protein YraQ (UPF0718 family)
MLLAGFAVAAAMPHAAGRIASNTISNVAEMLTILPPIFILLGLMDVWVPRETFVRLMGPRSGALGALLAVILGAVAAGPLYAAFPVASMMLKKGVSFTNVMVLLGAWSTLKIPMFLFETASLGARFSVTRWIASVPVILAMSRIIPRALGPVEVDAILRKQFDLDAAGGPAAGKAGASDRGPGRI